MPKDEDDIRQNHRIVIQDADQTRGKEIYDEIRAVASRSASSRCATTSALPRLVVAKGAGIGWLPTYMPAVGEPLIPLDIGYKFELDIWLAYHPDAKRIPRVRQLIEWTIQSFTAANIRGSAMTSSIPTICKKHIRTRNRW